jgi:hypothetical protein
MGALADEILDALQTNQDVSTSLQELQALLNCLV